MYSGWSSSGRMDFLRVRVEVPLSFFSHLFFPDQSPFSAGLFFVNIAVDEVAVKGDHSESAYNFCSSNYKLYLLVLANRHPVKFISNKSTKD